MSRTQSLDAGTALRSGLLGGGFGSIGGVSMERAQSLEGGQLDLGSTSLDLDRIDPLGLRQASAARNSARNSPRNSARTFRRKFSDALLLLSVSPSGERARCRRSRPRLAGGDGRRVRGGAVARPLRRVCRQPGELRRGGHRRPRRRRPRRRPRQPARLVPLAGQARVDDKPIGGAPPPEFPGGDHPHRHRPHPRPGRRSTHLPPHKAHPPPPPTAGANLARPLSLRLALTRG